MVINFTQEGNVLTDASGIYYIGCTSNNLMYIGSSNSLQRRFYEHRTELRSGRHKNLHLFRAYNKYGEADFIFGELDYVPVDNLLKEEEKWIRDLDVCNKKVGFNKQVIPQSNLGLSYKGAVVQLDKNCNAIATYDSVAQASRTTGVYHNNIGKVLKGERTSTGGFYWCYEDKLNTFKPRKNNYKGIVDEAHRNAVHISNKKLKTNKPPKYPILQYDLAGNFIREWNINVQRIVEKLKLSGNKSLYACLRGEGKTAYGYIWRYKLEKK